MKRNNPLFIGTLAPIFACFLVSPVFAAPVDCTASECSVSDGGASIATESGTEKDLLDVFLNGIDHLGEDEYHICDGLSNAGDCELPSISSATMDEVTNEIVVNFSATDYDISMTWTLDGSTSNQAVIDKRLVLTKTTDAESVTLTVLDYTGWDLFDDSTNDSARFVGPNTLRQTQDNVTADSIAIDAADFYAVHSCGSSPNCEDVFSSENSGGNLNNNGGPVSPYSEYSWQNNVTLTDSPVVIDRRLVISIDVTEVLVPVPTLPWLALVLLSAMLIWVAFIRRRKVF